MIESPERVEQFKREIAQMKLRDPATARDRNLLRLGVTLLVAGAVIPFVALMLSRSTTNPLEQRDWVILALGGVALAVVGAALFVRYSTAQLLRFWLARLVYEDQAQTDRVVEAIAARRSAPADRP